MICIRNSLNKKKDPKAELAEGTSGETKVCELEWIQEESSDPEDFILVESRKKEGKIKDLLKSLQAKLGEIKTK